MLIAYKGRRSDFNLGQVLVHGICGNAKDWEAAS